MAGGYSARTAHENALRPASYMPAQSRVLSALPASFIYGHSVLCYQSLATGDCIVQLPKFDVAMYLAAIERYKVNRLSGMPYLLHCLHCQTTKVSEGVVALTSAPAHRFDVSSVKAIGCGGAPLPSCQQQRYSEYFNGAPVVTGYGLTESSSTIAGSSWQTPAPGAVGVLYPNSTAKVIDAEGLETTEFGELCVSGPHITKGYIGRHTSPVDANGFLHTGDYARLDAHGNVFLGGRMADIVYSARGPISPVDIENVLFENLAVEDCAVASEGTKGQAVPVAYIVLVSALRTPGLLSDIETWLRERTGDSIACREAFAIPKSPAGKVLRRMLGQGLCGGDVLGFNSNDLPCE
ncbi:hypothetical protein GGI20_005943 [Coemansia sp. BCRC 34301]|nr:hypothetical protein GGI20_005943 [Coemansia sp. BCRC 34301]